VRSALLAGERRTLCRFLLRPRKDESMISPHSTDAESYETTLALLARVAPTMPPDARSRAAWAVATAKLDLKGAIAAEGFSLHNAPTVPAPKAAPAPPPTTATLAQTAAELASLKAKIAALRGPSPAAAAVNFPAEADHAGEFPPGYNAKTLAVHKAAMRLLSIVPMKYSQAIASVTRGMK
ncbi:MAG TPA: hypothetical protein VF316_24565, partial [Polyangiaceae bacterium]